MSAPYEITAVEHLDGHRLRLTFADGFVGDVDLSDRLRAPNGPMFEPLEEVAYFAKVAVDPSSARWSGQMVPTSHRTTSAIRRQASPDNNSEPALQGTAFRSSDIQPMGRDGD